MCRSFCSSSCGSPIVARWRRNELHCASRCGGDRYSSAGARVRWRAGTRNAMVHRCQHPGDAPGCWCCCWGAKGISVAHPEPVRRSIARAVARGATTAVAAHNCAGLLVCVCPSALPGETGPILRFSSLLDTPVADRSLIRRRGLVVVEVWRPRRHSCHHHRESARPKSREGCEWWFCVAIDTNTVVGNGHSNSRRKIAFRWHILLYINRISSRCWCCYLLSRRHLLAPNNSKRF